MKKLSPHSHLYRLVLVLFMAALTFAGLVVVLIPGSWNFDMANWYRLDSLEDMKSQPMVYGGIDTLSGTNRNEACVSCHKDTVKKFKKLKHKRLSCESCHEAVLDHVKEGKKVNAAFVDKSTWQCLNCHDDLINKPIGFPTFRTTEKYAKHREFKAGKFPPETTCLKCHSSHDPTP